jgi:hypothetical protein
LEVSPLEHKLSLEDLVLMSEGMNATNEAFNNPLVIVDFLTLLLAELNLKSFSFFDILHPLVKLVLLDDQRKYFLHLDSCLVHLDASQEELNNICSVMFFIVVENLLEGYICRNHVESQDFQSVD